MSTIALSRRQPAALFFSYALLMLAALVILYPFWILLVDSLKSGTEFALNPLGLPQQPTLANYPSAWHDARIGLLTLNSAIVAAATVVLTLALASCAAYGFSVFRFRGRKLLFVGIVALITIPVQVYIIPLYVIVVRLGISNTYLALILPYTAASLPLAMLLMRSWFDSVPQELLEAAQIDGCTRFGAFVRILMPLSRPALSAVAIFTFVHAWNEFFLALVFIQSPELQTLPLGLQAFFLNEYQVEYPRLFATLVLSIAPIAAVYVLLQRQFISGLTSGAVKG